MGLDCIGVINTEYIYTSIPAYKVTLLKLKRTWEIWAPFLPSFRRIFTTIDTKECRG